MTNSCRVVQEPSNGSIIIGQVHGNLRGSEVCKLRWRRGRVEFRYKEDSREEQSIPLGEYSLGERLDYTITCDNCVITVTVNGHTGSHAYRSAMWQPDRYHFAAGDYVNDNEGPVTEGGRVEFMKLTVPE